MAASVTKTETTHTSTKLIKWAWTAHTDGIVAAATSGCETTATFDGKLICLTTVPGTVGDAPDDNYGVKIYDANNVDVLAGAGLLRDTANTEHVTCTSLGAVAGSKLTLYVSGAGDSNKGTVYLYIR